MGFGAGPDRANPAAGVNGPFQQRDLKLNRLGSTDRSGVLHLQLVDALPEDSLRHDRALLDEPRDDTERWSCLECCFEIEVKGCRGQDGKHLSARRHASSEHLSQHNAHPFCRPPRDGRPPCCSQTEIQARATFRRSRRSRDPSVSRGIRSQLACTRRSWPLDACGGASCAGCE